MAFQGWGEGVPTRCALVLASVLGVHCSWLGGDSDKPDLCEIEVVGVETWKVHDAGLDAAYRVRGTAGSPATTWLAAETAPDTFVSGYGLDVPRGEYEAIVDLNLTGRPHHFIAVLEVHAPDGGNHRCKAEAPFPGEDS